jgi:hypothetical protein
MDQPDYNAFFRDYAAAYERSLGETVDSAAIRSFFAEEFLGAGVDESVRAGRNDDSFEDALQQGYAFYKAIGTKRMRSRKVEVAAIDDGHDLVRVYYTADYEKKDGTAVSIDFDVAYLLQRRKGGPKIFAFIAGDEMGLYRRLGLVDATGRPA